MTGPTLCKRCHTPIPNDDLHTDGLCGSCQTHPERKEFFENMRKQNEMPQEKRYPGYGFFCDDPDKAEGFKPARVAIWLAKNEHFITDPETEILYYGDEQTGTWTQNGEAKVKEIVSKILGEEDRKSHYENILHTLKNRTHQDIVFSRKIAVDNGLLDVETGTLTPPTLEEMAFHKIDCTFDKDADCPNFKEFLRQVLTPEDIPTLQEWSGYLLLPDYRFHKLMWLHGQGRNGKGVWQRTMENILGSQNVSSIGLEELDGNHRFALERLYGKLFNPCSEPTTNRILQTALLKKATGQDTIEAEIKGKQKRIKFRNTAKITVIANKFPKVRDETTAFKERRLFITFPNEFTGKNCITNFEKAWLENQKERSGILNWMLEGLTRLLSNGCFTESKTQEQTEIAFERASDTINAFITEMVIFDKNMITTRTTAYDDYKKYCDIFGLEAEGDKKFTQRLRDTPKISIGFVHKPKQERVWKGITLKKINDEGKIATFATDATLGIYSDTFGKKEKGKEYSEHVATVASVADPEFSALGEGRKCSDFCGRFDTAGCPGFGKVCEDSVVPLKCSSFKNKPPTDEEDS